ncbi:DNA pilot protein [Peromfec virus RodF8_21]|uniref:DNA pilot protein n=1 Tax=Peromfec virus RodF8_21 TaxID=2929363 RepID=A0A976N2K0_9VIRU|nr:DNA pilot protein [Peromfec virus RodF8_21]
MAVPFLGPLISGAASLLGGVFSSSMSSASSKEQIAAQKEENQKDRDFNSAESAIARQFSADEAQKARDYNTEMVNDQRNYDSASSQVQRLKEAGLNPNLIYQQLGNSSVGVGSTSMQGSSSAASHSGSVGGSLPDFSGLANAGLAMAQARLANAQADKVDSERDLNEVELRYRDQLLKGSVDLQNLNISLGESSKSLNEEQLKVLSKTLAKIDEEIRLIEQQWLGQQEHNSLVHEQWVDLINTNQSKHNNGYWNKAIKGMMAQYDCSEQEARLYTQMAYADIYFKNASAKQADAASENLQQLTKNAEKLGVSIYWDNEQKKLQFNLDKRYSDSERQLKLFLSGLNAVAGFIPGASGTYSQQ